LNLSWIIKRKKEPISLNMNPSDFSDENAKHIAYLLNGFITESLSATEMNELVQWVAADKYNSLLFEQMTDTKNIERMKEE
jgi:hypothetical protein